MKTVYFGRHGDQSTDAPVGGWSGGIWKANAPLSGTGAATALAIARATLNGVHPNIVVSSPITRAKQTAAIIASALNGPKQTVETDNHLGQGYNFEQWGWYDKLAELVDAPTTRETLIYNPEFMFMIATHAVAAIYRAIDRVPAGGSALLISHNPQCDLVVATLTGALKSFLLPGKKTPINIGKGDIVKITYTDNGVFQALEHFPAPKVTIP